MEQKHLSAALSRLVGERIVALWHHPAVLSPPVDLVVFVQPLFSSVKMFQVKRKMTGLGYKVQNSLEERARCEVSSKKAL